MNVRRKLAVFISTILVTSACEEALDSPADSTAQSAATGTDDCTPSVELCDGVDNDCDGVVDEYITSCETAEIPGAPPGEQPADDQRPSPAPIVPPSNGWPAGCVDNDRDLVPVCESRVEFPTDCNDGDSETFPGAPELCDSIDNDCDGVVDEHITSCETAEIPGPPPADQPDDDQRPAPTPIVPPAREWPEDCVDRDRDLVPACESDVDFMTDCNDEDPETFPGGSELCDAIDNDCDGVVDEYITSCETAEIPGPPPADQPGD